MVFWRRRKPTVVLSGDSLSVLTAYEGINWTAHTIPAPTTAFTPFQAMGWGGSLYCALTNGGAAATSPDGVTWTYRSLSANEKWGGIAWNNTVFCAVGYSTLAVTSPDGVTWTTRTLPITAVTSVGWSNSAFCAMGSASCATSADGIVWASHTLPANEIGSVSRGTAACFARWLAVRV